MKHFPYFIVSIGFLTILSGLFLWHNPATTPTTNPQATSSTKQLPLYSEGLKYGEDPLVSKTDQEWKTILSPELYQVARKDHTEAPFVGRLLHHHEDGIYRCSVCGQPLFHSDTKFDSGTGWPSFFAPLEGNIIESTDFLLGYPRTEISCSRCGSHLGHVFPDGPEPTGLRYCINDISLQFEAK
jgi:peptide-methionine (R)-S-oxide reductase